MGLEFVSSDFQNYLQPWYDTMKANTGFKGLVLDFILIIFRICA